MMRLPFRCLALIVLALSGAGCASAPGDSAAVAQSPRIVVKLALWEKDGYGSVTYRGADGHGAWVTRNFEAKDLLYPTAAAPGEKLGLAPEGADYRKLTGGIRP